ncbi:MAG TPA: hypothetical protein DF610_02825 [Sphingobacterium sp.]|jgi:hypothetical protein|nr:hypothetical protein BN1088_1432585 [Sphingobacterium sp. PM2-P1-29]HCU43986.1 hypothetical protein [Sphingobacterium sp.]
MLRNSTFTEGQRMRNMDKKVSRLNDSTIISPYFINIGVTKRIKELSIANIISYSDGLLEGCN